MATRSKENVSAIYPLSPLQQGLVFHNLVAPDSGVYVLRCFCTIAGPLDPEAFRSAWQRLMERYDVLRTLFVLDHGDKPLQIVLKQVELDWDAHDWTDLESDEQQSRFDALVAKDAARGFAIAEAPLFRVVLAKTGARAHRLLWSVHHAIVDGWSISLLLRDLMTIYETIRAGKPLDLPRVRPYADYIAWLAQQDRGAAEQYWRGALRGFEAPTPLPLAGTAASSDSVRPETLTFVVDAQTTARLQAFARAQRITLNTIAQGAWAAMLSRYSGQSDVLFGATVAGRPPALGGAEAIVGLLINTVPVRVTLPPDFGVARWLRELQQQQLDARQYEFCSLVDVHGWSEVPRGQALFDTLLLFESFPPIQTGAVDPDRVAIQSVDCADPTHYGLTLSITPGDVLVVRLLADHRFDRATLERMAAHFQTLIASMVEDPDRRVRDLEILPAGERHQLLVDWNTTERRTPSSRRVSDVITAAAVRWPERTAVVDKAGAVTYAELERRSNRIAHRLARLGIGRGSRVAVALERSSYMIAALLGVMKAGAAYVPLDAALPQDRLAFMLADADVGALVATRGEWDLLPFYDGPALLVDTGDLDQESDAPVDLAASGEDAAYVIYTSGSTGRPKGVEVPHRAVVNFLASMQREPGIAADDVLLAVTTLSFDIAGLELYLPLTVGARTVIATRDDAADGSRLRGLIDAHGVTRMQATPSTWRMLLASGWRGSRRLTALCGGEAFPADLGRDLVERCAAVWNLYGPTETTIWSTASRVSAADETMAIGTPIANTRAYVLDESMRPVPVGVAGELYLGGVGLAHGYHRRADLTAERFVPNPFSAIDGERLYRTGDLVRYRPDSALEYIGRIDHQVKLRGFRIELGEIESVLATHDGVQQALVMVREDAAGDQRLVAYVVSDPRDSALVSELKALAGAKLPHYMHPSTYVTLSAFPLTPNGKIDRRSLPAPHGERQARDEYVGPGTPLEDRIAAVWRDVLRVDRVGVRDNFFDLGGQSLLLMQVHARLARELDRSIAMTDLFQYPTVESFARHLEGVAPPSTRVTEAEARSRASSPADDRAIAIIGMACRFPGAADLEAFWANLRGGVESITFFSEDELASAGADPAILKNPRFVRARGVIDGADLFDASYFGFTPREAELLDPQQRLFLECACEALERAGCDPETYRGPIGVYAGSSINTYVFNVFANPDLMADFGNVQALLTADKDHLPTRVSYKLNLRGPSINIQTACSTSLVAVHVACRALADGECDVALAGGVSIPVPLAGGHLYEEGSIVSSDGHCRAFDRRAEGTVGGSGVGIVVLKRLDRAVADGDIIHAVIRATAINNDGSMKVGYTAPSVEGQAQAIASALSEARVDPSTIGYVEAHGTGTALGDPIEMQALTQVYRERTSRTGYCAVGSVKTNIGHLDAAAGVAGLIKATLTLRHGEMPPSLHFEEPNPAIDFASSPFFVNASLRPWPAHEGSPRRAAVSSFGLGGTNAHAVLEEAPSPEVSGPSREWQLLSVSAHTATALDAAVARLADHLEGNADLSLADAAYTLHAGRRAHSHRSAVVCRTKEDAIDALRSRDARRTWSGAAPAARPRVVFMFPGQGAQYVGMAAGLYRDEPAFRAAFDECATRFKTRLGVDVHRLLYAAESAGDAAADLKHTTNAQAALFSVEYALAQLWMSWGLTPAALIGHSIGEYVAACVSGSVSLDDAIALVAVRARMMAAAPDGAMLSVPIAVDQLRDRLGARISLAAINAPSACVVAGTVDAVEAFARELDADGIATQRLHTGGAFHSPLMAAVTAPLTEAARQVTFGTPQIPYISNVTGDWISGTQLNDPNYLSRHATDPVAFAAGVERLREWGASVFVEVGPGQSLGSFVRQQAGAGATSPLVVTSLRHPLDDVSDALTIARALGRLWVGGVSLDWTAYYAKEQRRKVELPTYPFERRRYWIDPAPAAAQPVSRGGGAGKQDITDWFAIPSWKRSLLPVAANRNAEGQTCLVIADDAPLLQELSARLSGSAYRVISAEAGGVFEQIGPDRFSIGAAERGDWEALIRLLSERSAIPHAIVYARPLGAFTPATHSDEVDASFFSLVDLLRTIAAAGFSAPIQLQIVTSAAHDVLGGESVVPERALALGPARVVVAELPHVACRVLDVEASVDRRTLAETVARELGEAEGAVVAYRRGLRWVQAYEPVKIDAPHGDAKRLRPNGVYLITGGLGAIGLTLADYLARACSARLVLVGRAGLPPKEEWAARAAAPDDRVARQIRSVLALEAAGAEVAVVGADVTSEDDLRAAVRVAVDRFGRLDGVIHAAGIPGGGIIELKERAAATAVLAPKVAGTRALAAALAGTSIDFLLLCSSINAVIGGVGQVDYCAANAFLDAFAAQHTASSGTFTVAVNWDTWSEVGMAVDSDLPEALRRARDESLKTGISNAEGIDVFRRVLATDGQSQIVVSTRPLAVRLSGGVVKGHAPAEETSALAGERPSGGHERPALAQSYVAPRNDIEAAVAAAFHDLFGIDQIGVFDNFFELGGHSLLATQLASRLRRAFSIDLPLAAVFDSPTVAGLSDIVFERLLEQAGPLEPILDDVQRLAPGGGRAPSDSGTGPQ